MVAIEVRLEVGAVKVRRFGEVKRWVVLQPGEVDQLTGWSCEELQRLGEGVWGFPEAADGTKPGVRSAG